MSSNKPRNSAMLKARLTGKTMHGRRVIFQFENTNLAFTFAEAEICAEMLAAWQTFPETGAINLRGIAGSRGNLCTIISRIKDRFDDAFGKGAGERLVQCMAPGSYSIKAKIEAIENGFFELCKLIGWLRLAGRLAGFESEST